MILGLIVVAWLPLFLCLPLWYDPVHYDICARTVLRGGVMYRDVFDNNLPGVIWVHMVVRGLFGWRPEVLNLADFLFFSVAVGFLVSWIIPAGRTGVRVWTAVALYALYLSTPEVCHCQRDVWMLLPALLGLSLRHRQVTRLSHPENSGRGLTGWALLEGLCWGAAVWFKPYVVVPALACWLAGLVEVRRARSGAVGALVVNTLSLLGGGLLAGGLGLAWLWRSGSWSAFWDVLLHWDREYMGYCHDWTHRLLPLFRCLLVYMPWCLLPLPAAFLAWRMLRGAWRRPPQPADANQPRLTLLAAFYLGWFLQAFFLQLPHDYVLIVPTLLAVPLIAAEPRLANWAFLRSCFLAAFAAMVILGWPVFGPNHWALWLRCVREGSTPAVRDQLTANSPIFRRSRADAVDLKKVADFLRRQGVQDGEVTCMTGCTHPLLLDLDIQPPTRFPEVSGTTTFFPSRGEELREELARSRQRFVVSDLCVGPGLMSFTKAAQARPGEPASLPPDFPREMLKYYPWSEPVVFHSGRYVVQRVTGPAGRFWFDEAEAEELFEIIH
ncbi:MAG: hypothetical protein JO112_18770, partial [Planctomycetes bacterium]|nr:hypothetical protein [Planctomycetota bacterium]